MQPPARLHKIEIVQHLRQHRQADHRQHQQLPLPLILKPLPDQVQKRNQTEQPDVHLDVPRVICTFKSQDGEQTGVKGDIFPLHKFLKQQAGNARQQIDLDRLPQSFIIPLRQLLLPHQVAGQNQKKRHTGHKKRPVHAHHEHRYATHLLLVKAAVQQEVH